MAGRGSYGDVLREARERRGFDIASMARKLHIRPDILKAIEEGDFERTPARGYTKNMVRSYANNLGLDASRITEMYLNEVHAFETGRPPSKSHASDGYNSYVRHRETRSSRDSSRRYNPSDRDSSRYSENERYSDKYPERSERLPRTRYTQNSRYDHDACESRIYDNPSANPRYSSNARRSRFSGSGEIRNNAQQRNNNPPRQSNRSNRTRSRDYADKRQARQARKDKQNRQNPTNPTRSARGGRGSRNGSIGEVYVGGAQEKRGRNTGYPSIYSQNSHNAIMDKLPFLGIVAVVAIVVIIILVVLFNGSQQSANDIPDIPISGLTDTSNPEGEINSNVTETAPTEAVFRYAVDDGEQSWIEIYENDSEDPSFAGVVTGPEEEEIKVTDKLVMLTANPGPVHAAVDGNPLEFTEDSDSAYYKCEVDFKEILDKWKQEHPSINISSSSSSSSSSKSS